MKKLRLESSARVSRGHAWWEGLLWRVSCWRCPTLLLLRRRHRLRMTAQELLQFLLVLGRHVVEDGLVDPLLVVEIRPPLLLQIDMRLSQNHLQISALRGHPAVQEIGRVIGEP